MAHRHKMLKRGGRAAGGSTHDVYAGSASGVAKEARQKGDKFSRGGHHVGKVHGGEAKGRLDKRARGGAVGKSPFSSAARMEDVHRTNKTKDAGQPRAHGGRTHPLKAKHPLNYGAHHGAGHEEPLEHHMPIHHKHGGTTHHLAETKVAHGGAAGHGKSGHAPGGTHAGIHHPMHHKRGGEVMKAVGAGKRHKRKHGGRACDEEED